MWNDYTPRKANNQDAQRILLYVHGGGYFFGAVDEHRYQIQRHARKLKARAFAVDYRLAPQFPFPCGLHDAIAAYLHLLDSYDSKQILLAGDSAGAGMVLSTLVIMRDQGIPLPAGAILLSPWVDLTHSFPSLAGDGSLDYIPNQGFHHRPSPSWPPPSSKDLQKVDIHQSDDTRQNSLINEHLVIEIDGERVELRDQIQMYTTNQLLSHPLVSPVFQPSLGGLPPLLIQAGGGELLKDEQIYLAHKAANPAAYPSSAAINRAYDPDGSVYTRYQPTQVQLQVWDDLCHVAHTLSFTRPAKYMYRAVAQFGVWAYNNSKADMATPLPKQLPHVEDTDTLSIISTGSSEAPTLTADTQDGTTTTPVPKPTQIGTAGDPLPPFTANMIRQAVTRHGDIYALADASELPALNLDPDSIGLIKPGPVRKWLVRKREWDAKFAKEKARVQKTRALELARGYVLYVDPDNGKAERPPPTALAGRRDKEAAIRALGASSSSTSRRKNGKTSSASWGLALWAGWGSRHDETTIERQDGGGEINKARVQPEQKVV